MNGEVNCCWGNPDEVYYTIDGDKKLYQLDLRCNGRVFGIWDGVFLMGNYNDDTDWMMHDEFIIYYIYYNGWDKLDIVPSRDVDEGCWDYDVASNTQVEYSDDSYYDEDGDVLPEYQMTYGELIDNIGDPEARGRLMIDYNNNNLSFVAFWSEPSKQEKRIVAKNIGNPYVVVFNSEEEAKEFYLKEHNKVFTYKEWLESGKYIPRIKKDENAFQLHLMNAKDKWNNTSTFRDVRDRKNADKLGDMTMAQYHSLVYQESRNRIKKIIREEIEKLLYNDKGC